MVPKIDSLYPTASTRIEKATAHEAGPYLATTSHKHRRLHREPFDENCFSSTRTYRAFGARDAHLHITERSLIPVGEFRTIVL